MFCLRFGLNDSHILYSLAEIAQKFDLTGERVRQILSKQTLSKEPLSHSPFWKHYFVQDFILITDSSTVYKDICSSEKVFITFEAFAEICNIIFKFQFSEEFDCKFCCSKKHFSIIHTIFSRFDELKKKRYSEDTTYNVCDIVPKQALIIPGIEDAIYSIVIPALHISVSNGSIFFNKNFVDIEKEAFDILYQKGEPMHIEELVSLIKGNNVHFQLNDDTIRNKIRLSKHRLSFDERFQNFKEFVNTYLRIPYCSGADDEDSLYRWYNNVLNGNISTTDEQRRMLNDFVDSNKELPQNGTEVRFKKLCQEYIDYVKSNYELPSYREGATLYNWLKKTLPNYLSYNDNRKTYFSKLIEELETYGFYIG